MAALIDWINTHGLIVAGASNMALWLFSAIITAMPDLPAGASFMKMWVYRTAHVIAANLNRAKSAGKD